MIFHLERGILRFAKIAEVARVHALATILRVALALQREHLLRFRGR